MKVALKDLPRLVSGLPPQLRAILVYGPDDGHVSETAEALARSVVDDLEDPFRVTVLHGETLAGSPGMLMDAATTPALTEGRRLVRLRHVPDRAASLFAELAGASGVDSVTVAEAGALRPSSPLRKLFETSETLAALPCYGDDGAGLRQFIREVLGSRDVRIEADALDFLAGRLGADRRQTRAELEKLALMAGPGQQLGLAEVVEAVGDSGELGFGDIANAVARGDAPRLERALVRAWAAGDTPVGVLRLVMMHFQRLHQAASALAAGRSLDAALSALRPPVIPFNRRPFGEQVRSWQPARIETVLRRLHEAERQCKSTGIPDRAICGQVLLGICLVQRQARGRQGRR